ncbi:transcription factor protein [Ciona intestinalis]
MELSPSNNDEEEVSLTLQFLLENPALLGHQDVNNNDEKCGEKCGEASEQNDLASAYLGPQIWNDMLLSDDLKLEPVDLDDLLKENDVNGETSDFRFQMSPASSCVSTTSSSAEPQDSSQLYQDMPGLVPEQSFNSSTYNQQWFHNSYKSPQTPLQNLPSEVDYTQNIYATSPGHYPNYKMEGNKLREQQIAIYADIMAASTHTINIPPSPTMEKQQQQQQPSTSHATETSDTTSYDNHKPAAYKYNPAPLISIPPIEIRLPTPVKVDFTPSSADVLISTPQSESGEINEFNPCTRQFTDDELKPKPMVRKSRKVHVSSDSKDVKYWNRRNKNNVAAKRSREARRIKENQIAMRANFLEKENESLKMEVSDLRSELKRVMNTLRIYEKEIIH